MKEIDKKAVLWEFLQKRARKLKMLPSMTLETSLLGDVPYQGEQVRHDIGNYLYKSGDEDESFIPTTLQNEAKEYGFLIIFADYKTNKYTIRLTKRSPTN